MNKVIARFTDGRMIKGMTADFLPAKDVFHISEGTTSPEARPIEVHISELKALFFVKDFEGDPGHVKRNELDPSAPPIGRAIRVTFKDGEVLVGTTTGYQPSRPGFFVIPVDPESNNERCFVITASTAEVSFL